jgi:hypothetical protein
VLCGVVGESQGLIEDEDDVLREWEGVEGLGEEMRPAMWMPC